VSYVVAMHVMHIYTLIAPPEKGVARAVSDVAPPFC
jgi:hypothetical protein